MALKGIRGRLDLNNNETKDVTVSESGNKVALDVNIVSGATGGGGSGTSNTTAANQITQISEAQSTNAKLDALEVLLTDIETNTSVTGTGDASASNQSLILAELQSQRDPLAPPSNTVSVDISYVTGSLGSQLVSTREFLDGPLSTGTVIKTITYTYDANENVTGIEVS